MRWRSVGEVNCSVARTLAVIGERWTMLILREAFMGRHRFDDFQRNIGIARNILATRLRALVKNGILERSRADDEHARIEYRLTKKGMELYPVMVAMLKWGDAWLWPAGDKGPPLQLVHRGCGAKAMPALMCPHCGDPVGARDMIAVARHAARPARRAQRTERRPAAR
ncbi:MAG: winged helix-turn-helix transcriptional regulator [Candidatus Binataceae bacterium]